MLFTLLLQTILYAQNTPTVIELFTSQGCSSCPPADALLEEIKSTYGENVITLSYHVDYWDYIGWKDPFATKGFTQKQYTYAEKFRSRSVYTPQAVINGRSHYTGSDRTTIYNVLNSKNSISQPIALTISEAKQNGNTVSVDYKIATTNTANELTFVVTINEKVTQVKRGENRNRTLKNTHIVVAEQTLHRYATNGQILLQLPDWIQPTDQLSIVAYATKSNVGIIDAVTASL
ncbi:DUF1223 domain-containing protein [uncultured Dokdonia sp.]|uniref:DUF1223 domain-containing protein n=1 Tax=uncultured Dokdonia sp. TaxID=575653 RepID=UPI002617DCF1|nr:DUF1223 domain-containing protein [uncultured Dokdonia sp.]